MKNKKISVKTVTIVILIGIIIAFIITNLNNKNNNLEQQLIQKEQLGETTGDNAYVDMQKHTSEVQEKEQKLMSFKTAIANAITEMGVETSEDADVDTMVNNIKNIQDKDSKKVELLVENYLCNWTNATSGGYGKTMTHTFDVTSIDSYDTLTENNFIIEIVKMQTGANADDQTASLVVSKSYDATTGKLVVSNLGHVWHEQTNNGYCSVFSTVNIWIVR